ncbi:hypothetical protein ACFPT7_14215 [Acidicapsa dinghuensis]|uniref:Uncharacterized protein n=1 Tax=Acidicapsa dinghuensis TaxID=2218256 RepID=A0ABW1EGP5_9BACT|nr:hypothetical protein [Acidicapsa dinghuensis]
MKAKSLGLAVLLAALATSALAQTQFSASSKCAKPDNSQSIEVGDHPGHMLVIEKSSCTWSAPVEMGGFKSTGYTSVDTVDAKGATYQVHGYAVLTMESGDKVFARYSGTGTMKGDIAAAEGTWSYTGGTGKFKGLKGNGTYKGSGASDGSNETQLQGEYSLPEAGVAAKKK